jgi:ABC-type multidrug transport system ATPase subunit
MNAARIVDAAKSYGAAAALQGLHLEIAAGGVTALLGANGPGKTTTISMWSGGQQRRVQFALALCGNPDLLCLDEPTVGLDSEARAAVWVAIRSRVSRGCAVLLTTHDLEEAEGLADRVAVLAHGRAVMTGTVDEVRALSRFSSEELP